MKRKGQITRIKNGKWQIRVQRKKNGVRKSISEIHPTRAAAEKALSDLLAQIELAEKAPKVKKRTFNELFDEYLLTARPHVREQTHILYEKYVRLYLRPRFGALYLDAVTPFEIEKYYIDLQAKLKPKTISQIHAQLKAALKKARMWKWVDDNAAEFVRPPKIIKVIKDTLTADELNRFFEACLDLSSKAFWLTFALTGARAQEVCGAKWKDVDFENNIWKVSQVLVQTGTLRKFDEPKTETSKRQIPLSPKLGAALKKHRIKQMEQRLKIGEAWADNDLIFPRATGEPQGLRNIGELCTKIRKRAGIDKNATPHLFRHSFATLALHNGANIKSLSEFLGHARVSITLDIYSHVNLDDKRKVSNVMSDLLSKTG